MTVTVYSNEDSIEWGVTGDERIIQNVRNILRTRMFEVPFMREMGLNPDFTDSAPKKMTADFKTHVTEVIEAYEKRVQVADVRIESCDENGNYIIAVDLEV